MELFLGFPLGPTIAEISKKLKLFSDFNSNQIRCSIKSIPLRSRSTLILFMNKCVVTARLLIMVKHTATLFELQSAWAFLI